MTARIAMFVVAALFSAAAYSKDLMRCGNRLVSDGDPKAKVVELCGQPTTAERRTVLRSGLPRLNYDYVDARRQTTTESEILLRDRSLVEVEVEVWLYNRGRSSLLRELVFHDNRLVDVNVLGHGY